MIPIAVATPSSCRSRAPSISACVRYDGSVSVFSMMETTFFEVSRWIGGAGGAPPPRRGADSPHGPLVRRQPGLHNGPQKIRHAPRSHAAGAEVDRWRSVLQESDKGFWRTPSRRWTEGPVAGDIGM